LCGVVIFKVFYRDSTGQLLDKPSVMLVKFSRNEHFLLVQTLLTKCNVLLLFNNSTVLSMVEGVCPMNH